MPYYISPPPMNPLSRLLAGLFAVLALAGVLFFGVFVLAIAAGLGLIAWLVLWMRMLWLRRKLKEGGHPLGADEDPFHHRKAGANSQKGEVIDAEYTVVSRREER